MSSGIFVGQVSRFLNWARASSLWYFPVVGGCCADEVVSAEGCRYDLERLGCLEQSDATRADLLLVSGGIHASAVDELRRIHAQMLEPRYVVALGACANRCGIFKDYLPVTEAVPVDVFVPGCPPRPEAIMNGILKLQERIRGHVGADRPHPEATG